MVKKCPKSKKLCNFFLRIILSFEKKLEKVKIFKKSPKFQFLPDFQKLLTKMCGRPRALKKIYIYIFRGSKVVKNAKNKKKWVN